MDLGTKNQKSICQMGKLLQLISKDMWEFTWKTLTYIRFVQMEVKIVYEYITLQ